MRQTTNKHKRAKVLHQVARRRRRYLKRLPKIKATKQRLARKRRHKREMEQWEWNLFQMQRLRELDEE